VNGPLRAINLNFTLANYLNLKRALSLNKFGTNPGVTDRMEIESKTKKELNNLIKYLNLDIQKFQDKYLELFGIVIPKAVDLTFQNCKKTLLRYVKKNKSDFIHLVDSQIIKYNKLKKIVN
jgi:hypothetical protein